MFATIRRKIRSLRDDLVYGQIYKKYRGYTMIARQVFAKNLAVIDQYRSVPGCVVECGTWRGGMSAGIAELLGPDRHYYLFDSFEGLPQARSIDGPAALAWQADPAGPHYHNNCTAEITWARRAMALTGVPKVTITKGWFNDTLPNFCPDSKIAILRLDADWFESTLTCLETLYPHMSPDGAIILDDYYAWDGCSRAVHHFLAKYGYAARFYQPHGICVVKPNFSVMTATSADTPAAVNLPNGA